MLTIVVEGWLWFPHSYAIVNMNQISRWIRRGARVFRVDVPAFVPSWKQEAPRPGEQTIFFRDTAISDAISSIPVYDYRTPVDIVYRISYPHRLSNPDGYPGNPKIVLFSTAEFQVIPDRSYVDGTFASFVDLMRRHKIASVMPSEWSKRSLPADIDDDYNKVIPHGVDTDVFKYDDDARHAFRSANSIPEDAFVYLNIGAMSGNKNIPTLIGAFLRIYAERKDVYLVLKGLMDIYAEFQRQIISNVNSILGFSKTTLAIEPGFWDGARRHIIVLSNSMSSYEINGLYSAADCYVSPYSGEGFNLPVLEAMATGLTCILPSIGPTTEFEVSELTRHIQSTADTSTPIGGTVIKIDKTSLLREMFVASFEISVTDRAKRSTCPAKILKRYTWDNVSKEYLEWFKKLTSE